MSAIKDSDLEILKNTEILAINQDPVFGTSISPFRWGVNVRIFLVGFENVADSLQHCSPIGQVIR